MTKEDAWPAFFALKWSDLRVGFAMGICNEAYLGFAYLQ
jgi:hypothetical protein